MSKAVKCLAVVSLSVALSSGSAYAGVLQPPGSDTDSPVIKRVIRVVRHLVRVILDDGDDMTIPHP